MVDGNDPLGEGGDIAKPAGTERAPSRRGPFGDGKDGIYSSATKDDEQGMTPAEENVPGDDELNVELTEQDEILVPAEDPDGRSPPGDGEAGVD